MTISTPNFSDPAAARAWDAYFDEVTRRLRPLSRQRRREITDELVAHVLDGLDSEVEGSETDRLSTVLTRMGSPSAYLDDIVEDAARTAETGAGWRFGQGLRSLARRAGLGASYLLGLATLLMAIGKFFYPENVGLFRMTTGWIVAGYVDNEGATELLGAWFIPIMLLLSIVFWYLLPRRLSGRRTQ